MTGVDALLSPGLTRPVRGRSRGGAPAALSLPPSKAQQPWRATVSSLRKEEGVDQLPTPAQNDYHPLESPSLESLTRGILANTGFFTKVSIVSLFCLIDGEENLL